MKKFMCSIIAAFGICTGAYGATISIEIPDAQLPYVQVLLDRENEVGAGKPDFVAFTAQSYIQKIVANIVNAWEKQLNDEKLIQMKTMLLALSPAAQAQLISSLEAKAQEEGVTQ